MNSQGEFLVILSTTDQLDAANRIAEALINDHLAACVQVEGPIRSFYRWEGKIESAKEFRLVIKTTRPREQDVFQRIRDLHGYETPQILSIPVTGGHGDYLDWVRTEVDGAS